MKTLRWISLVLASLALAACGEGISSGVSDTRSPGVSCESGTAQIAVYDGLLENLCGCAETGTTVASGTALTCTVAADTRVVFQYVSTRAPHQIISSGSPSFVSSQPHYPPGGMVYPSHGVVFSTAGTYVFADSFDAQLGGSIVVTP